MSTTNWNDTHGDVRLAIRWPNALKRGVELGSPSGDPGVWDSGPA